MFVPPFGFRSFFQEDSPVAKVVIELPAFFAERLVKVAHANGASSAATYVLRLLVSHVAAFESVEELEKLPDPLSRPSSHFALELDLKHVNGNGRRKRHP